MLSIVISPVHRIIEEPSASATTPVLGEHRDAAITTYKTEEAAMDLERGSPLRTTSMPTPSDTHAIWIDDNETVQWPQSRSGSQLAVDGRSVVQAVSTPRAQSPQVCVRSPSQLSPSQRPPPQLQPVASAQCKATSLSTVRPLEDPVAIVVYTTRYNVVGKTTAIELPRHVVILNWLRTYFDYLVICNEPIILAPIQVPQEQPFTSRMRPKSFDDMLLVLTEVLRTHFVILYDRESTFDALRFAIPLNRAVDLGRQVILRNDALREGGLCWCRSRRRLVNLKQLWMPLLRTPPSNNPVDRARGMLQLFDRIAKGIPIPPAVDIVHWTPPMEWQSAPHRVVKLNASLRLEVQSSYFEVRAQRALNAAQDRLAAPVRGSAPFSFELCITGTINNGKVATANALMRLLPHPGLALLQMLIESDLIPHFATAEVCATQNARIVAQAKSEHAYGLNVVVYDDESRVMLRNTIDRFLLLDNEHISAIAATTGFPEFDFLF